MPLLEVRQSLWTSILPVLPHRFPSANITGPGGGEMVLHADQLFVPEPWPAEPQGVNVAWCVDEFRADNGATCVVPGSQRLHRNPGPEDATEPVPIEAPVGTMAVFESRVWHRTGFNRTQTERRAGIFGCYTLPIYRQQENWFLSLNPMIRQFASEDMLVLLKAESYTPSYKPPIGARADRTLRRTRVSLSID